MSESIKPSAWKAHNGSLALNRVSFMPSIRELATPLHDQAALEAARQEGFRSAIELTKNALIEQEQEIADLSRQLAAAQALALSLWWKPLTEAPEDVLLITYCRKYGTQVLYKKHVVATASDWIPTHFIPYPTSSAVAEGLNVGDTTALDTLLADKERETIKKCAYIAESRQFGFVAAHAIRAMMTKEKSDEA